MSETMRSHEEAASLFLQELAATRWDIPAFARLLGVKTHKGQQRMFDAVLMRDSTAIRAMYLNIAVSAGNRAAICSRVDKYA